MYALELPLLFSFRPKLGKDIKLITNFGLYALYGFFGRQKYEYIDNTSEKNSSYGPYNRADVGLDLGIGVSYKKLSLIASYQRGFTNAEKEITNSRHQKIEDRNRLFFLSSLPLFNLTQRIVFFMRFLFIFIIQIIL